MDITSQRLLLGASAGGDSYWQLTHGQLGGGVYGLYDNESHVVSDANQNAYWSVNLYYSTSSPKRNGLFKVSKDGDLEFKVRTNSSTTASSVDTWSMAVSDADGALYSLGNYRTFQNALTKTDLNYTDLAAHTGSTNTGSTYSNGRVILTSTGAPIVCSPDNANLYINRLSSSLTAISSFRLAYSGRYFRYHCQAALLSDGSILCLAAFNAGNTTSNQLALTLLNSTASSVTWARYINAGNADFNTMAVDASNNIYILYTENPNGGDLRLIKYNSSGVLQWAKQWNIGSTTLPYYAIWHDNQFIVCGDTDKYTNRKGFVASFDSDGNKLWDNYSNQGGTSRTSYSICPAGPKAIYFVDGNTSGLALYKVPTDGGATNAPGSGYRFGGAMPATTTTTISEQSWTWTTAQAMPLNLTTQTPDAFNTVTANPTLTPIA